MGESRMIKTGYVLMAAAGLAVGYVVGHRSKPLVTVAVGELPGDRADFSAHAVTERIPTNKSRGDFDLADLEAKLKAAKTLHSNLKARRLNELGAAVPLKFVVEAVQVADRVLNRSEWSEFQFPLLSRWAESAPRAVLAYAMGQPKSVLYDNLATEAAAAWGRQSPTEALNWLAKLATGTKKDDLGHAIIAAVAEKDPHRALKELSLVALGERASLRADILEELAKTSPVEALEEARKERGGRAEGSEAEQRVLEQWMRQEPGAVEAWMRANLKPGSSSEVVVAALGRLQGDHPAEALRLAEALPSGNIRERALSMILSGCEDLAVVRAWSEAQTDPKLKPMGQLAYAHLLSKTDPATAAAAIAGIHVSDQWSYPVNQIFEAYAATSKVEAAKLAASLPLGEGRSQALNGVVNGWARTDPAGAADFAMGLPAARERNDLLQNIARNWAESDPAAVFDWLGKAGSSALPARTQAELVITLADFAPEKAAEFATSLHSNGPQAGLGMRLSRRRSTNI